MTPLLIKRSIAAILPFIGLAIVCGIIAIIFFYQGNLGGWCLMPMAIALLLSGLLGLRDNVPRVIITESGITVRVLGPAEIPWQSIKSAEIQYVPRAGQLIVLERTNGKTERFYGDLMTLSAAQILKIIEERIHDEARDEAK